jgi:hypothetical protein
VALTSRTGVLSSYLYSPECLEVWRSRKFTPGWSGGIMLIGGKG